MPDGGYIRLFRKLLESPIWTQLAPAVLKVAIYFLLKANWKQANWYDGRRQVTIPRGAFITSYATVASECGITLKQARSACEHLSNLNFAAYARDSAWTMVTVLNYEDYQTESDRQNGPEGRAQMRAGGWRFSGQGEGTDEGTEEGTAKPAVSDPFALDAGDEPEGRAQMGAGALCGGGQALGRARAQMRATEEEIKNLRTNTCASEDAHEGSLPSIDNPPFESLLPEASSAPNDQGRARSKKRLGLSPVQEEWFNVFWSEFWLRVGKEDAVKAFAQQVTTPLVFEEVMGAVRAQKPEMLSRERGKQKQPAGWLNGKRWEDEIVSDPVAQERTPTGGRAPVQTTLSRFVGQ